MHDTLWNRRGIIKTANVSAIREMRASVCIGRSVVISPFSKDEENDDDEGECVRERGCSPVSLSCMFPVG